jgi:hypothetical protein
MLSFGTYANDSENKIAIKLSADNCVEEVTSLEIETKISSIEVGKIISIWIGVDCDGDGIDDYIYSGNIDSDNVQAQVDSMIAAC